jgi:hypothetical protein
MESDVLIKRIEALEAEVKRQAYYADMQEIQMLQARYIYYLENGKIAEVWDELYAHDEPDVRMEIMDSGAYVGAEHVRRAWYTMAGKLDKNGDPAEPKAELSNTNTPSALLFLMLTISTPYVVVSEDGRRAWGQWHLFGPHTNRAFDPETMSKRDVAFWIAGKYDNEYVKENGAWKFKSLRPICWIRSPFDEGWLRRPDCRRTPTPYWPPDEPSRISSFNPDEGFNPDKWGPAPREWIGY